MMRPLSILMAIEILRLALIRYEALFDAQGNPTVGEATIRASEADIAARFLDFACAPCRTHDDVQTKVDFVLNGASGLSDADGWQFLAGLASASASTETRPRTEDGPLARFLRSLLVPAAPLLSAAEAHAQADAWPIPELLS